MERMFLRFFSNDERETVSSFLGKNTFLNTEMNVLNQKQNLFRMHFKAYCVQPVIFIFPTKENFT